MLMTLVFGERLNYEINASRQCCLHIFCSSTEGSISGFVVRVSD